MGCNLMLRKSNTLPTMAAGHRWNIELKVLMSVCIALFKLPTPPDQGAA